MSITDGDVRKEFLLTTIANYYSLPLGDEAITQLNENEKLNNFLDDGNSTLLSANIEKRSNEESRIILDNATHVGHTEDKVLVFFKIRPDVVTPENLHTSVLVSSMLDSPVSALYHSLQKVYSPLLLSDAKWSHEFDPKLQGLITELEKGLGSILRRKHGDTLQGDSNQHSTKSLDDAFDALASILTPTDETQYWADVANTATRRDLREMASSFWNTLEPIANEFNRIDTIQLADAEDVLETCHNTLDDLWKLDDWVYPQKRMVHLMDIVAHSITRFVQAKSTNLDLWKSPYGQVEESLQQGINLCEKWVDVCQKLTSIYWANYTPHMWEGGSYKPDHAANVQSRLKEILSLRALHKQLTQLLSIGEQEELKTNKSFEVFAGLNPIQYNPYTEPLWRAAVNQFGSSLIPAESRIAGKLKYQLRSINGNTLQFLQEFKRYLELIQRPSIQRELITERENLLGKLSNYISKERKNFTNIGPDREIFGIPKTINNIYFVRQLEGKIKDILKTGGLLLYDLGSWPAMKNELDDFIQEMIEYRKEQFDSWTRDNLHQIENDDLSLQTSEQVVYFEAGKRMKVSYNPRLVGLTREVRMLSVLGFNVPNKILVTTELAKKFARQAKELEQIATFHNTIGGRMIISQRPMMLDAALGLANLVKEQTDMTWNNTEQVQRYIAKLQQCVEQLARQNNKLAGYHKQIKSKVLELIDTDLLKQQTKWKEGLKDIRQIMSQVEQQGFTNLKTWRNHWDRQLYKALEHQYQVGLEALNEHLPEIKVEVIYRQQCLQFLPPIEEIRMKYFSQLKRFLAIPNNFRGVSETTENSIFPTIVDRNAHRFSHLFQKAEDLFNRLDKVKDRFNEWVALGSVDVEDYIMTNFKDSDQWEQNFRASKSRGQDIGRLPSGEEKLDCISVSFAPVRTEVELLNRKFWDTLVTTLQRSIIHDIEIIEKFATEAMATLRKQPQSVEEIGQANQKHVYYSEKSPEMLEIFENADKKNKVLSAWTKEQMEQVERVTATWDNFQSLMDNHEMIISKQVDAIKSNLNTQVKNVNGEIDKFKMRWDQMKPKEETLEGDQSKIVQGITFIKEKRSEWTTILKSKDKIVEDCSHFGIKEPSFPKLEEVETDLAKHEEMWGLFEEFNSSLRDMSKEEWIIFRSKSYRFEEFLTLWYEKLQSSKQATTITVRLLQEIERYKIILPILKYVRGEIFSEQHWAEMYGILGMPKKTVDKLLFEDFLKVKDKLAAKENELQELNNRAGGEVVIRQALNELDVWEVEAKFSFVDHQTSVGETVPLIKDWKDTLNKVGDNQVLLQSIKGSAYYNSFGDRAAVWEAKLAELDEVLNNLNSAQRKWVYLEPYQEQMKFKKPSQTGGFDYREVFRKIDDDFRMIMKDALKDTRVVSILRIGSVKSILNTMLDRLERCQKSLNEFLEEKRSSFPRFYFIGDDDLLQILGQATKPAIIQTHLKKLFAGIHNVNFDSDNKHIITMNSLQGEIVPLKNKIKISNEVEGWLNNLAREMKNTLQHLLIECLKDGRDSKNGMDPLKYPSQILCLAESILFTERCEESIRKGDLRDALSHLQAQLDFYTSVDLGGDEQSEEDGSGINSKVLELKLKALILDTIHHISIVEELIDSKVRSVDDWLWKKQLRFYMNQQTNTATISMVDADFEYTYEYQGNASKLVHTPLTDKCYMTLTQGMRVGLGGNPYGPAGTGKTESVKALGGLFGRQVLVFNCDEGIDVKSMGRIFIGLIKCGAWGCFDEFNRLEEQTLSAVSMQIQPIQTALKNKKQSVMLLDKEIPLDHNSGIFVTMNPAGKKYGGRQKLPDNLKQLFRPVAMSKPDIELIADVSLHSEGFKDAKNLGQKLVGIFNMSKRLLSVQQHYDWGLRALNSVLKGCGNMLKMTKKKLSAEGGQKQLSKAKEGEIVVQALRLNTLSKLTFSDSTRFDALIRDVFLDVAFNNEGYEDLKKAIRDSYEELELKINENQIRKVVELYEQLQQRMGVVIVGPSGSGKTTLFTLLKHALSKMGRVVKQHTMNPKAIPRTQLLGQIDLDTREWTNGVLTVAALEAVDEPVDIQSWIICDGDVDPEWVESLNSVLDDNRLLTLPSGWRIQFGPNVNFIFETHDLSYASPATISRMGMIFLSDEDVDSKAIISSWLAKNNADENLTRLMDEMFIRATNWCMKHSDFLNVETSLVGCILNGLAHMRGDISGRLEFGVALVRGLGGNLNETGREAFAKEIFKWCGESHPGRRPSLVYYNAERDRLDTYSGSSSDSLEEISLADFSSDGTYPVVQTADVKAILDILLPLLDSSSKIKNQPFLLVGPEGSGKSLLLHHCFKQLRATNVAVVHCSANITPQHVIQKLSQVCLIVSSSNGRVFRPKECDRLILYLKDLNLAKPDKYGTCMLIAFLQQILTYGGFYDNLEWVGLEAVQIVGSMSASGGGTGLGRHQLSTRFTSVLRVVSITQPDKEYLDAVCSTYLGAVFNESPILSSHPVWSSRSKVSHLASSMVSVYSELKQSFSVDDNSHYVFTPRDLTKWTLSLVRYVIGEHDKSPSSVLEAWAYEACRLFRDKLVTEEDIEKFDAILKNVLYADWNSKAADNLKQMVYTTSGDANFSARSPLPKFGRGLGRLPLQNWEQVVEKGIVSFGRENRDLDVILIDELLELVARCDRALSSPGGSLLMVGRSGVGRRTAISIVSALHQAKLVALKMGKNYSEKQFKGELKGAMQIAGGDGEPVFLVLEDHNLISSDYLDMINSLLSSGEVPGLYTPEELEPILTPLREKASNEGFSGNLVNYFSRSVRKNLHVILIMDCSSPTFIQNCESNPALYKQCEIQWMEYWSQASILKIPKLILTKEDKVEGGGIGGSAKGSKKKKEGRVVMGGDELLQGFYNIFSTIPKKDTSMRKYVTFIKTYQDVHTKEQAEITSRQSKLSKGVSKLLEAREVVKKLKGEAAIQEKELAEKQHEANEALQMITDTMRNANTQKTDMEGLKGETLKEEKILNERKKNIELEMAEIGPLVEEAKKAVGNIKSSTLSEIRSLRAPPNVIRDILEGVLCLMGIQDTSWNSMKSFLAKRGVKDEILSFDARRINPKNRQIVETLLEERANSFDPATAKKASTAAVPLASWVTANVKFSYVLEKIKPLEREQAKLQRNLKLAEDQIGQLSSGLEEVDAQVAVLKERLNKFTKEAAEIEIHLNKTKETIGSADSLVEGLEGEFDRWNSEVEVMEKDLGKIPLYSLLAAAFLTYLSNAPEDIRKRCMEKWQVSLGIKRFDLKRFLSSEREMLQWRAEGLPSDDLSIENAMCILQSKQSPYLIDPSSRASKWLLENTNVGGKESGQVEVTTQYDDRFVLTLELAIRFGKTLILQEVNSIDPVLYPILRKDFSGQGVYKVVPVGDKQVDYNPNFRLFMTTRNANPDIPPDAKAIISTVNFTTTRAGLTGQLLAVALQHEKPELEQRKSELLKVEEEHKIQITKLEDYLLEQLASSTGNILENKELLASLNETKDKSASIAASLKESIALQDKLEKEGNVYLPVAKFASKLYFTICDLSKLNNMYRISLASFLRLFQKTLKSAQYSGSSSDKRINSLRLTLQEYAYRHISRSLFKADRLTFAMHLAHGMHKEQFQEHEWDMFTGLLVSGNTSQDAGSLPSWIDEDRRPAVAKLKGHFPQLYETLQLDNTSVWGNFARGSGEEDEIPVQVSKQMTPFQQVLLVQALKPERLVSAMETFVIKTLNLRELSPPALSLKHLFSETMASEPILIIISSGSDASEELRDLAVRAQVQLEEVAMGQGQAEVALSKLHEAAEQGHWLCLKNLHLMTFWIPNLEKELQMLNPNEKFRLWLTAEPHPKFSPILSESSLKVTYESPPGIKRNLQRTLQSWSSNVFRGNGSDTTSLIRAQSIFALAWFHAVVQERRTYIPQGWCKFYEFSDGDLKAGLEVLNQLYKRMNGSSNSDVKWEYIHGLYSNAIYGGRVDDSHDVRILASYLEDIFNSDVLSGSGRARGNGLGPIVLPSSSTEYKDYLEIINKLPEEDKPSFFGLPANIQRSYQRTQSSATINQLRILMRSVDGASKFEREKWNSELAPILNLWKKLNQGSSLLQMKLSSLGSEINRSDSSGGSPRASQVDPVKAFIHLEFYNAVTLLQKIHKSLVGLSKVIRGTALLDEAVSKLADFLMRQETPSLWQKIWEGPEDPMDYIKVIVAKVNRVEKWSSKANSLLQSSSNEDPLDLSDLFHPDTFLGAFRQATARHYGVSMESLKLINSWSTGSSNRGGVATTAKLPIKVTGLVLEGGHFDGLRLSEASHDSPSFSTCPVATFAWIPKTEANYYRENEVINLPLYHTSDREKILSFVDVPAAGGDKNKWLKAGIVLYVNIPG